MNINYVKYGITRYMFEKHEIFNCANAKRASEKYEVCDQGVHVGKYKIFKGTNTPCMLKNMNFSSVKIHRAHWKNIKLQMAKCIMHIKKYKIF